jgi:hypothetical protein
MAGVGVREALTQAIRYWEPRRLLYNGVLVIEVVALFAINLPVSRDRLSFNSMLWLFALAVLANIAYCACYVVDVTAQLSDFRTMWLRFRWGLFALGTAFACVLAYFFSFGLIVH